LNNRKTLIKVSEYHDSVSLMAVAQQLARLPGLSDAAVVMATEANKDLLKQAGLLTGEAEAATANDLVIAVSGESEALDLALGQAEELLQKKAASQDMGDYRPKSLRGAAKAHPEANLAVISVAGRYAAGEAWEALQNGLHVLLFSDNVSIEDEIALKRYAVTHGLLLMGPGAGTAILNGVALGFANILPRGPVGIVSAAGTGLQEVSCLLARQGIGITQGIGTGGRDLKAEIGGLMMLAGLKALQADPDTRVILLVSKPPAAAVAEKILAQIGQGEKPAVVCFLGGDPVTIQSVPNALAALTLEQAAHLAAGLAAPGLQQNQVDEWSQEIVARQRARLQPGQRYLRALYSGGTLCYEAQVIWQDLLAEPVHSNAPLFGMNRLPDSTHSIGHSAVDLGEEEFTVGRPHPMIDHDLRIRRLLQEAQDPETALIVLDVVLGYGAHPDPAAELGPAVQKARRLAAEAGRELIVVASVTGVEEDPQCLSRQVRLLEQAGVVVCSSNAAAARLAAALVSEPNQVDPV
jgi:succinyl-CoA synthetase alpha subunit